MRKFIPFRHSGGKEAQDPADADKAYQRRREQVRRAQRTHRERKEAYTKSLESEVLRLRSSEAQLLQQNRDLNTEVDALRKMLADHRIDSSTVSSTATATAGDSASKNSPEAQQQQQQQQQPQQPMMPRPNPVVNIGRDDAHEMRLYVHNPSTSSGSASASDAYPASTQASSPGTTPTTTTAAAALTPSEITEMGLDFVLTLEAPCLPHTHAGHHHPPHPHPHPSGESSGSSDTGSTSAAPTGHALTVSATLLEQCPFAEPLRMPAAAATWQTTQAGLERLLDLSGQIEIAGECTPVQAWHHVRSHPAFAARVIARGARGREWLRARVTAEVAREVRCYAFGAMVDRAVLEEVVESAFAEAEVS